MKIKNFNQINETLTNEDKARKAGYNVGDTVYNYNMKKRLIITNDFKKITSDGNYCSLGAVGEFPESYTKIKGSTNDADRAKNNHKLNIENAINGAINKAFISKEELKSFINDYIDKI